MAVASALGLPIGLGLFVTSFFWPCYWRQRIYSSDLFAARVGQLDALINALDQVVHPFEKPKNVFIREYPLVAERIDRLMRLRSTSGMAQPLPGQQGRVGNHP